MYKINIKPLSVNKAYRGRKFATNELKQYKSDVYFLLPNITILNEKLSVYYEFGLSSKGSDGDNLIKAFQDILSERYNFNDNKIYRWEIIKKDVKKGEEYVIFDIKKMES